jgi:hypothetical protein
LFLDDLIPSLFGKPLLSRYCKSPSGDFIKDCIAFVT